MILQVKVAPTGHRPATTATPTKAVVVPSGDESVEADRFDGSENGRIIDIPRIHGTGVFTYMNGWFLW